MALSQQFLDEVRARTVLSALVGRSIKLTKSGREFQACCPFHAEKSPSFTVSDDKGFAHCFGCGWHGDAIRWLTDHDSTPFIEAVRELAAAAGLEMPAQSAEAVARTRRADTARAALEAAQAIFVAQLGEAGAVMEYLAGRGIGPDALAAFGIGFARGGDGSLRRSGIGEKLGQEAGLLVDRDQIGAGSATVLRELFWDRITVPIHDARGALAGFGGRVWPGPSTGSGRAGSRPKFINSPDGPLFDKGRLLFNQHRAREMLREHRQAMLRRGEQDREPAPPLLIAEGYFDVVQLHLAGFAAVAPMGTALTERQIETAWRLHHRPVLLFDGDKAGLAAAARACRTALALIGPGRMLAVATLPAGQDPDDLLRTADGIAELRGALEAARGLHGFLFDLVVADALQASGGDALGGDASRGDWGPEATAAIWSELSELAGTIADDETRAQYLGKWRARFDRELSAVPQLAAAEPLHSVTRTAEGDYAFPDSESDSAGRLIAIVRAALHKRAERKAITEELGYLMKMAAAIGFVKSEITAVLRDIESDLEHGPGVREEAEMSRVLYRRTLGIRGPMNEAMLPQIVEGRARAASATIKRRAAQNALIDASALSV